MTRGKWRNEKGSQFINLFLNPGVRFRLHREEGDDRADVIDQGANASGLTVVSTLHMHLEWH